jgi:N6-adenosine-specific RNA methylase IME4
MINFPKKKYKIIYADPPWTFTFWSEKAQRKVSNHYQLMTANEIYNLPVSKISEENCILFLWVTYPNLLEGLETIKRWGFTYKTCGFSWIKKNKIKDSLFWGMGYYTRSNNEICLLATKGKPKRISSKVHQVVIDKIREHSRKPDCIRDRIVELCGDVSRIELFARQDFTHKGWDHWGNELNE